MELRPGDVIVDKYRLDAPIGQGGMASVWRAMHLTIERPVAIKFLDGAGLSAERRAERFLREAKIAAAIRHRHVVDILDYGVLDATRPFIVMELLEGVSLADRLDHATPLPDDELLSLIARLLSGLAAVHAAGIVHRDMKPENVFLVDDGDSCEPKIVDFGISRLVDAETAPTGRITSTGAIVGTPEYMSPEQARGLRDIDGRSDLFSVGTLLYEGLAGRRPFDAENPGDVLIQIATQDARPLDEVRPDLPEAVLSLVDRALARDRDQRFQSAREMREAVLRASQTLPAASSRATVGGRSHRPSVPTEGPAERTQAPPRAEADALEPFLPRRRPIALALALVVGAAFAIASGIWWVEREHARAEMARSIDAPAAELDSRPALRAEDTPPIDGGDPTATAAPLVERDAGAAQQESTARPSKRRSARGRARPSTGRGVNVIRDLDY